MIYVTNLQRSIVLAYLCIMTTEEINELENRLHGLQLPEGPIELYPGSIISDIPLFISRQLNILKASVGKKHAPPAYHHLKDFIAIVEEMQ